MTEAIIASDSDYVRDYIQKSTDNFGYFCRSTFPEVFRKPFSELHREIIELIDMKKQGESTLCISTRGIGKTSLVRAYVAREILLRRCHFVLYISRSLGHAEMSTEAIKWMLLGSEKVRKIFGDIRKVIDDKVEGLDDDFSKKAWVAFGSVLVLPRGVGQQVRGLNWRSWRPDLPIIDDLEDREEIQNPEIRKKIRSWFFQDLAWTGEQGDDAVPYFYIDTMKHSDSLVNYVKKMDGWNTSIIPICGADLISRAPNFMSDKKIAAKRIEYASIGQLDGFYMEVMCEAFAPESAAFKQEYFRYFNIEDIQPRLKKMEKFVIADPARSANAMADYTAIIGVAVDYETRLIYVLDVVIDHLTQHDMYRIMFQMCRDIGAKVLGYEETGLKEFISYPLQVFQTTHGYHDIELVALRPRGGESKPDRIKGLTPLFRMGMILFSYTIDKELEIQLLSFTGEDKGHDDGPDALAYLLQLLQLGDRSFFYPVDSTTNTPEEMAELDLNQIEYDEPLNYAGYI